MQTFSGNIVDVLQREIFPGTLVVENGMIADIKRNQQPYDRFITPGFIDAHVHIESAMMPPSEFARIAVTHGTVATVSDPHEIANVLGVPGVRYMMENAARVPLKFYFSAPSCVPATAFETSGAKLTASEVETLLQMPEIRFLGEMMNFPGVIYDDPEVKQKLAMAAKYGKPVDGHCPGLTGDDLKKYVSAGITTDHECFSLGEALEKLNMGMKILIREGSAAQNFDTLIPLAREHYPNCMFCSDDKHPDDLQKGHINLMVKRALATGLDPMNVLQMASINPIRHYGLTVGLLKPGDSADFLVVSDLDQLKILQTVIDGKIAFENGQTLIPAQTVDCPNRFNAVSKKPEDFFIAHESRPVNIIDVLDGQLVTGRSAEILGVQDGGLMADPEKGILKLSVVNRYEDQPPALGFARNFGLKKGAIAGSIAHDSHNIIAVGTNDNDLCTAVNRIIENKGGICVICEQENIDEILPLPIAGLMSDEGFQTVSARYTRLDHLAKQLGSPLKAPFMTLSFMALLVIPEIKLSDKGLFDGNRFEFIELFQS